MRFENKVCLVTGASSGLGRELALEIGRRGGRVALLARREKELAEVAAEIEAGGGETMVVPVDIRDTEATERAVDAVFQRWGRLDVAIANAGVGYTHSPARHEHEQIDAMIEVNLRGAITVVLAAVRIMIEQGGGHIAGISSIAGYRALPMNCVYSATKAALNTFLESVRIVHARDGVRVTTVCPGFVRTPMIEGVRFPTPQVVDADAAARKILRAIEKGRSEISFPFPFANLVRLGRYLPNWLYDPLVRWALPAGKHQNV